MGDVEALTPIPPQLEPDAMHCAARDATYSSVDGGGDPLDRGATGDDDDDEGDEDDEGDGDDLFGPALDEYMEKNKINPADLNLRQVMRYIKQQNKEDYEPIPGNLYYAWAFQMGFGFNAPAQSAAFCVV